MLYKFANKKIVAISLIFLTLLSKLNFAQSYTQENVVIDSVPFVAFTDSDNSFSNFLSPDRSIVYRKYGDRSLTSILQPFRYKLEMQNKDLIKSKIQLDEAGIQLGYGEPGSQNANILLSSGKLEITSRQTWINGDMLKVPVANNSQIQEIGNYPKGSILYNESEKSLYASTGNQLVPAYWEWYNHNEANNAIFFEYSNNWTDSAIPIIRLRHPINVTGIQYATTSEKLDYIIAPYQYGIVHRYSGIMEWDVPEFSVHVGTMAEPLDLEQNNKQGWGGILWVGDDTDKGGVRATARNGYGKFYSEISSEKFDGKDHGPLRLRVVDDTSRIEFITGGRGSENIILYTGQSVNNSIVGAGGGRNLYFQTNEVPRLSISQTGNVGIGETNPQSMLDVKGINGYEQLRLQTKFTPSGSNDINGKTGNFSWDDDYIYIKTSAGWKRSKLESF